MTSELVVELGRKTIQMTLMLAAPILIIAMVVSLVINIVQVLTSVQEQMISTVPRLLVTAAACFLLMPWMLRKLVSFTIAMFSDFRAYVR